jgi:hypothetical protein
VKNKKKCSFCSRFFHTKGLHHHEKACLSNPSNKRQSKIIDGEVVDTVPANWNRFQEANVELIVDGYWKNLDVDDKVSIICAFENLHRQDV